MLRREGEAVALVGYGSSVNECLAAADSLQESHGLHVTVCDARFCKPLDTEMVRPGGHFARGSIRAAARPRVL